MSDSRTTSTRRPNTTLRVVENPPMLHGAELERLFRLLAERMSCGEYTGASVILWSKDRQFKFYRAGVFKTSPMLEHLGACKLADRDLYQDEA